MKAAYAVVMAAALGACTPNGIGSAGGGGGSGGAVHTVDLNLTVYQNVTNTPYGQSIAVKPPVLDVAVGDTIVFKNADGFNHTSTSLPAGTTANETKFPNDSPLKANALSESGATLSGGWSSGALQAGSASQNVLADKAGTYLYGCFYHYSADMRGAIVAR